ncbi:hypothetical protein AGMMS50262_19970 [Bacteroidia bacterium]|nr:hypothetical protein AGMMS50262_16360 [Bacteroidia bacterium]GHT77904.1 hypothetical protein AGMMS50262_19970 [Bacteroidia bacterium]
MKKLIFFSLWLFSAISLVAQNVTYVYDNAGNRTSRTVRLSSPAHSPERQPEETALEDFVAEHSVKIYPNPTKGMLAVEISNFDSDVRADFLLTDMSGKVIDRLPAVSGYETLNLSRQPAGLYVLRITINGEATVWKIIKE